MTAAPFVFAIHDERLAICRLPPDAVLPAWAGGGFLTISRTASELSIVCAQANVPADVPQERDRIALGIAGVVPMATIGVLASLCGALAAAQVPVFVISTFDTDYLLVSAANLPAALDALGRLGHSIVGRVPD